ncbi:MAG: hypothetical protein O3A13_07775 [Proteobacteria bacterium]|nr:hypothetical protein [Pseudomonadota bacterium]MDA0993519.1 hypothetical protein [Pseudomonadota bacterium]
MNTDRGRLFKLFKYGVYALLTANIFIFFVEEWTAAPHRFADGVGFGDIIEGFTATIDTAAWVILLLMFELETYVLDDKSFTNRVTWSLHGLRAICYGFIVYSFYGYIATMLFMTSASPFADLSDLCTLVDGQWSYAIDLDEYTVLTGANCAALSTAGIFMQLSGLTAVVDQAGLADIIWLTRVDVINAGTWLLVVLVLEFDVRLQEHDRLKGGALKFSNFSKYVLYSTLLLAAIYWGFKGDFVDFWDAFLWLVAFVFIELNVVDWRKASLNVPQGPIQTAK